MELISNLLTRKQDPIFEAAKEMLRAVKAKLDEGSDQEITVKLPAHKWIEIVPGDAHSPQMMCFEKGEKIIIRFPSNSTPYCDTLTKRVKKCLVFSGTIYDQNNPENIFRNGDEFKVYPRNPVVPYTKDLPALAYVELE